MNHYNRVDHRKTARHGLGRRTSVWVTPMATIQYEERRVAKASNGDLIVVKDWYVGSYERVNGGQYMYHE